MSNKLLVSFFTFMCAVSVDLYAQDGAAVNLVSSGDSYLDGLDNLNIEQTVDLINEEEQDEVASYLDAIMQDLASIESINDGRSEKPEDDYFYGSLDDCVDVAVKDHLPISIAQDKIELSKRKLLKALRTLFPGVRLLYEHNRGYKLMKGDSDPGGGSDDHQRFRSEKIKSSFSQPLYKGGALWNQVKVERSSLKVAESEYEKVFLDLRIEVSRGFLNLVRAKTTFDVKKNLIARLKNLEGISQEKMDAGLISEVEHLNVSSQQSQLDHDLEAAKEDYELNIVEFRKVMHLDVNEPVEVNVFSQEYIDWLSDRILAQDNGEAEETAEEKAAEKVNYLVKLAYENRPEFMIQKHKLIAAEYLEKVANGGWMPQVNLVAEFGQKAEAYTGIDNNAPWDEEHHIGLTFKWNWGGNIAHYKYDKNRQGTGVEATDLNVGGDGYYDRVNRSGIGILNGLEQYSKTKEAEIKRKEAMLELELSEKDIVSEVKEAYYAYNRSLIKLKSSIKKLSYRKKMAQLAQHRSEVNEIQISEYIQAEMDLAEETNTLIQSIVDYFLSKEALNKAIGVRNYLSVEDLKLNG